MKNNRNGCLNIRKIFKYYLDTGGKQLKYCRTYNKQKYTNPSFENFSLSVKFSYIINHKVIDYMKT